MLVVATEKYDANSYDGDESMLEYTHGNLSPVWVMELGQL